MKSLRPYQTEAITAVAQKVAAGKRRIVFQLATGGGKTVTFSGLSQRWLSKQSSKVLILVHRSELLHQARRTLYDWYEIIGHPVVAGQKYLPNVPVYTAMVETAYNRLRKNPNYFGNVGLVIIDECHLGNFKKMHQYFPDAVIIGFTATPISASKKEPLKDLYEDIVCGIDIPDLITSGALVRNQTYHIKNIDRKTLKIKGGEFDDKQMGNEFSKARQVSNTVEGYRKHCEGSKAVVFNCNVEHSKIVTQAFIDAGYPARHLDATCGDAFRKECLQWLKDTPGAILNNVGILTTGFDEPGISTVIVNKATTSLPLWLQMTGRGSRPFPGKELFTILDMGGNALTHGDWCAVRDWEFMFHNPDKPSDKEGVAPVKSCDHCEAIVHASVTTCPVCGGDLKKAMRIDSALAEFELLTEERPLLIAVDEVISTTAAAGYNSYAALHRIKDTIISKARRSWRVKELTDSVTEKLHAMYQEKVKDWCHANDKGYNQWHKETTRQWFEEALNKVFTNQQQVA
ncbi:DEAD/DEAH box helicase [Chitinophaga sp. sic0106]|uniref:DEAD/DEAH box helicase n=1 Tax=Chitinophaga sp. sic0106 TaxID=2854785 RepID=UPI001C45578A|nr:DEAD/DEAH box helicase [Chitinophaga sp. sic0106]MBV7534073.1 DEAD/DEAH box helicase [Chitinophaga sp. sic0106]